MSELLELTQRCRAQEAALEKFTDQSNEVAKLNQLLAEAKKQTDQSDMRVKYRDLSKQHAELEEQRDKLQRTLAKAEAEIGIAHRLAGNARAELQSVRSDKFYRFGQWLRRKS